MANQPKRIKRINEVVYTDDLETVEDKYVVITSDGPKLALQNTNTSLDDSLMTGELSEDRLELINRYDKQEVAKAEQELEEQITEDVDRMIWGEGPRAYVLEPDDE